VVERFSEAMAANDLDTQDILIHDDYVGRWPQSGEVIRGRANRRAILENYPGLEGRLGPSTERIVGTDDEFLTGPSWNIIHLTGSGDELTVIGKVTYPNGEAWHFATLLTLRDGKIWRQVDYFAPPFDAPAWRSPFVDVET